MVARPAPARVVLPLVSAALLLVVAADCATATAIEVEVYTDVCPGGGPVGFAGGGSLADLGTGAYASVSDLAACTSGSSRVGRVVLSPSGSRDAKVAFELVVHAGGGPPERCSRASYAGCIVARRQLPFLPRSTVTMRVDLRKDCLDVSCASTDTCVRGRCVSADTQCEGNCDDSLLVPGPEVAPDGGTPSSDGGAPDASLPADDAGTDAGGLSIVDITSGLRHTCVLWSDGVAQCWGDNASSQIGGTTEQTSPTTLALPGPGPIRAIAAGGTSTCVVLDPPTGVQCRGELGAPGGAGWIALDIGGTARQVVVGQHHACALDLADSVSCWGSNTVGQLGNQGTGVVHPFATKFARLYAGAAADHTCGVLQGGTAVSCWSAAAPICQSPMTPIRAIGLAQGSTFIATSVAANVACGTQNLEQSADVLDVSGRQVEQCTLDAAGKVVCFDGTAIGDKALLFGARRISSGAEHSCVLRGPAEVTCFGGTNASGQLGAPLPASGTVKPALGRP